METSKSKRGWVKTAAIIFLAVMLVLTFFSNTILNRSTPEVSTYQVQSGTITQRIRGSGVVEAVSTYTVKIQETRKVLSVPVRVGDMVNIGDLLIVLGGDSSAELKQAKTELESMEFDYRIALMTAATYDYSQDNLTISRMSADLAAQVAERDKLKVNGADIAAAETAIIEADIAVQTAKSLIETRKKAVEDAEAKVKIAQEKLEAIAEDIAGVNEAISNISIGSDMTGQLKSLSDQIAAMQSSIRTAQNELESYRILYSADYEALRQAAYDDLMKADVTKAVLASVYSNGKTYAAWLEFLDYYENDYTTGTERDPQYSAFPETPAVTYDGLSDIITARITSDLSSSTWRNRISLYMKAQALKFSTGTTSEQVMAAAYNQITSKEESISQLNTDLSKLQTSYSEALSQSRLSESEQASVNSLKGLLNSYKEVQKTAQKELETLQKAVSAAGDTVLQANEALQEKNTILTEKKAARAELDAANTQWESAGRSIELAQRSLEDAINSLASRKGSDATTQAIASLNLGRQKTALEEKRAQVQKLEESGSAAEIAAPVSGVIKNVSISPGDNTPYDSPLIVIEQADRGYSLSFSVTNDQASRLRVGDLAELSGYYWGNKPRITLKSIRNDPTNPREKKQLVFEVTGEGFEAGYSISVSLGSTSDYYEAIVPNSAVRSDSQGEFVLLVKEKQTPLGTRYVASRADVRVLTKDDNNSAVSGVSAWQDQVILSSAYPISSGSYVRPAQK